MEEMVTLYLETYDEMRIVEQNLIKRAKDLEEEVKILEEEKEIIIKKAEKTTKKLHEYILKENLLTHTFDSCSFEKLTNFDSRDFGINYKGRLIELGITKDEMINFITDKYNEWKEEQ